MKNNILLKNLLHKKNLKISFAESITGGLISARLVKVPGASDVMSCSIVAYSDEAKIKLLNVPRELIREKSSVSPEVAIYMSKGLYELGFCDIAVSITGYAGPTSCLDSNNNGLIYYCIKTKEKNYVYKMKLDGKRTHIQKSAAKKVFKKLLNII